MGYKRTEHKNALFKLVREKGLILQKEAADRLNRNSGSLKVTVESLVEEGKIKRQKIKQRFKNGNLNEVWLLYMPGTSQNLILNYEMELVNKPFESPLKEHHCYKKLDRSKENSLITEPTEYYSNIIDMAEYVKVNDKDIQVIEIEGKRVVTFKDVDELHQRPSGTTKRNFNSNKEFFEEGKDFYLIKPADIQKYEIRTSKISNRGMVFLTESGYYMITKSFTDKLSWEVQRQLVDTYFKMKQLSNQNETQPIPTGQIQSLDIMEMMIKEMKKEKVRVDQIEEKLNKIVNILSS